MQGLRICGDDLLADTGMVKREACSRLRLAGCLFAFTSLLFFLSGSPAIADPRPLPATVLTELGDRVYVAADSGALASGDRLAFADRKHVLATGRVEGLLDGRIASVRLESGTLAGVKKLAELHVTAESAEPSPLATLHVGIPMGARRSRLVACAACTLAALPGWRSERTGPAEWRAVHEATAETLLVRSFRDADDESIAWERGDLDVAVFWPDELSAMQRARFHASDLAVGVRSSGLEIAGDPHAAGDPSSPETEAAPRGDCPILLRTAGRVAADRLGTGLFADLPACVR
jgi:hypothetical protein